MGVYALARANKLKVAPSWLVVIKAELHAGVSGDEGSAFKRSPAPNTHFFIALL